LLRDNSNKQGDIVMYDSIQDIKLAVEDNGGSLTLSMRHLRDAYGLQRCRSGNVDRISIDLKKHGFIHHPDKLPSSQDENVHIFYDPNSPLAKRIKQTSDASSRPKNGISSEMARRSYTLLPAKATHKPIPVKMSSEERFGEKWHDFGPPPTDIEYVLAQLDNAKSSVSYNVVHSRLHPHSEVAKDSYLKNVERVYANEQRVWEVSEGQGLPKGFKFIYFNAKGVPAELIGEPKEGTGVINGYVMSGFGKLKIGAGIKLPINLNDRPRTKR